MPNHDVYDPDTEQWAALARLPVARDHVGVAVVDGKIHVYRGRLTDDGSNTGLHDIYDPSTDSLASAARMPVPVSSGTFAQYKGLLIYLGGECKPGQHTYDDVEACDPKTDSWRLLTPIPAERHANAAAVANGKPDMFGGALGCGADRIVPDNLFSHCLRR
jgi:hypothetical protein